MKIETMQRYFLIILALGLAPIALSYGAIPAITLPLLYGGTEPDPSTQHIFRAVMGLYFGMITFWLFGAGRPDLRVPALWSVLFFVSGVALGRIVDIIVEGWPSILLSGFLFAEFLLAAISWYLIKNAPAA